MSRMKTFWRCEECHSRNNDAVPQCSRIVQNRFKTNIPQTSTNSDTRPTDLRLSEWQRHKHKHARTLHTQYHHKHTVVTTVKAMPVLPRRIVDYLKTIFYFCFQCARHNLNLTFQRCTTKTIARFTLFNEFLFTFTWVNNRPTNSSRRSSVVTEFFNMLCKIIVEKTSEYECSTLQSVSYQVSYSILIIGVQLPQWHLFLNEDCCNDSNWHKSKFKLFCFPSIRFRSVGIRETLK